MATGLTLSAFTGTFQIGLQLRIVQRRDKLYRQKDGTDDIELIPESAHKFFMVMDRTGRLIL